MSRAREQPAALPRCEVVLEPLPAPDALEQALPEGAHLLLTDDGTPLSDAVAQLLARQGWQVTLLQLPAAVLPPQPERARPPELAPVALASLEEDELQAQLAALTERRGPIAGFIHLHPRYATPDLLGDEREGAVIKAVFLLAKHLHPHLTAVEKGRAAFLTVTRLDGALGLHETAETSTLGGGLMGLTKSLDLEWPSVFCRAVDLDPALEAPESARLLLGELTDPDRHVREVGWRAGERVTLVARPAPLPDPVAEPEPEAEELFLVSGGAKGITAACVVELARHRQADFLLVGRSPQPAETEPAWSAEVIKERALKQRAMEALRAAGEQPTPQRIRRMVKDVLDRREILATLDAVAAAGGRAHYVSANVTDGPALRAAVAEGLRHLGGARITGILHGAGVIADKAIAEKTEADFERVYAVKVEGLRHLLACVPAAELRHLILFSSVAGFYGNVGQTDYALANEVLNKAAHRLQRRHPHCHVQAIDWGPWDGGMVTPALKRVLEQRQVTLIPVGEGTRLLAAELAQGSGAAQTVVGPPLLRPAQPPEGKLRAYRLRRTLTLEANPFLRDHVIGGHAVLPTVCAAAWGIRTCEGLYPGYRFFRVRHYRALKGIVFDESLAGEYVLEVQEVAKDEETITLEARVLSQPESGLPRYHYSMEVTLCAETPPAPDSITPDLEERQSLAGAALYEDGTLFHGPAFQGVERVLNLSDKGLTMRCRLPRIDARTQGQFAVRTFNPYVTDVQLQSLLIWAKRTYGYGGLPLSIQGGQLYRPLEFDVPTYVTLAVRAHSKHGLVADVTVHDAEGALYSRITGAEITLSPRLNELFAQNRL